MIGVNAFTTVNAAVAAVAAGGLVIVNGGTYAEAANVNKAVTVRLTPGAAVTINSLDTAARSTLDLGANTRTVGDATPGHVIAGTVTGTGDVVVAGGTLGGTGGVAGTVTADAGAALAPGEPTGTLTVGGAVLAAGATFQVTLAGTRPRSASWPPPGR